MTRRASWSPLLKPLALVVCLPLGAGGSDLLMGAGLGPLRHQVGRPFLSLELQHGFGRGSLGGWVAWDFNERGGFVGLGPSIGVPFREGWELRISSGPGLVTHDLRIELGLALEFRSTLQLTRSMGPDWKLGASFSHYSNAGIADHNPGAEVLRLFVSRKL
nr:acyloxyacyl hydrolase [uncultured Holophaga sp.]